MKINRIALYIIIAAINLAAINAVKADDFNFTVPIQMNNLLPEVDYVAVYCEVTGEGGQLVGYAGPINVPVPDSGNLSANVAVNFNANYPNPPRDPSSATHYQCYFNVVGGGIIATGYCDYGDLGSSSTYFACAKPGTPFTRRVDGTIP